MNPNNLEQELIQTLELCLTKMSKKLKSSFDPQEKIHIQLLQQFRSTISTYYTCLKRVGKAINQPNKANQNPQPSHKEPHKQIEQDKESIRLEQAIEKNDQTIARLMKDINLKSHTTLPAPPEKPSGLLCYP